MALLVKNPPTKAGNPRDVSSIPVLGRSPGVGNGTLLQYSCLENSTGRGAWWAAVHGATKSWTRLSAHIHTAHTIIMVAQGFPRSSVGKESTGNAGDLFESYVRRSPGEGNGNPLQCSCLGNPMDRGAWQVTVHGVTRVGHDLATRQ